MASKKDKKGKEPASMFEDMSLFDIAASAPSAGGPSGDAAETARPAEESPAVPSVPSAPATHLTGTGPMRDLFDYNFREYSAYVICSRAIPAVEDGFKPVQRRIMHSLWEKDDGRYTKVANIVGHAMQYHPHGDASIGDAIVVLANKLWGEGKGYLIDGQGNYGSLYTGMPHAATRYIECRLTELARKHVFNPKTTQFVPNYDGRKEEPVYLPSKLPLLLMMGADGIAVGLSTAILPHNFIELLEAEIAILRKEPFEIYPDFQLGGVMDVSEYQDGLGKVRVRAVIENGEKNRLVITELPWGETTDSIAESIEEAIKKKKVQVRHLYDLTSDRVRIELELATGATQEKVLKQLYAFTSCEKSLSSRPIVLVDGRPRLMKVSEILRKNVERLTELTRRELEIRRDELAELFHARTLDRIFVEERVYKKIENEKTYEGVQSAVLAGMAKYRSELRRDVTAEDVERLLQIKIRRISQFDIDKNRKDIADILAEEKEVADNLAHLKAFTIKYLKGLVKEYSKKYPRATRIQKGQFVQADVRKLTASELTIRWDKDAHFVGSGIRGGEELFKCSSLDRLLFVWKDGRYRMCPPEEKIFVDKDLSEVLLFNPEKDREREFTAVYEEPLYGFSYIKFFSFGGMINNKEYRLAPEKSKLVAFMAGCPQEIWVKYRPAKNQRIHQQHFNLGEYYKSKKLGDDGRAKPLPGASYNGNRGKQVTTKGIARLSTSKPGWWDDSEESVQGVLI